MTKQILRNLKIEALNQMQLAAIDTIKNHADSILLSPTGSGKTLAYLLAVLERLNVGATGIQALVLAPSRELALQIEQVFKQMSTGFKVNCCYGGHATQIEKNNLKQPPALLIGTPGRIAWHIRHQNINTSTINTLVLDEFDKALEYGFEQDMAFIIGTLEQLQKRILISATKMDTIPAFAGVAAPGIIDFLSDKTSVPQLRLKAVRSTAADKLDTLFILICSIGNRSMLVFCNHRDAVDRISDLLFNRGLEHDVFHGGMEQEDRERALIKFRNGSHRILITTDLASRGLDIPAIDVVIHYQLPHNREAFLHRNGRTARMHAQGTAYIMLTDDETEPAYLAGKPEYEQLPELASLPAQTEWATLYIAAGKKDKVNKFDIVGLLLQKGGLQKDELGLIEVLDYTAYAAVKRYRIEKAVKLVSNEKLKNKKVKIEIAR